jgi:methionine-rich copper-binding protein CopC
MRSAFPCAKILSSMSVAIALSAIPAMALGHVSLTTSTPAAGENLDAAPDEVTLTFDGELDPAGSSFTVHDHDGTEVGMGSVDLMVADRNVMSGSVDIAEPGVYTVEWTALGADGHEIAGAFSFGYATEEEVPAATGGGHEPPNTAMPAGSSFPFVLAGIVLLSVAILAALRRLAVLALALTLTMGLAACVPAGNVPDDCDAAAATRNVTLVEERLEPATLEACRGQELTIQVAVERDAILHIHGYDAEAPAQQVEAGETVTIAFQAVRAGQFPIAIHTTDGPAEATVGTLVVHER